MEQLELCDQKGVRVLIAAIRHLPLHSFTSFITFEWGKKMIECPRAAWVLNKLCRRRMSGKNDKGVAMSFTYFCSL